MKKGYTHIVGIIDRSYSMQHLRDEVIGAFNTFLDEQQKVEGQATITLVQFDDQYEVNYTGVDINKVSRLSRETYTPRGMTAMLDAIGKTIIDTGKWLSDKYENERPEKVVVLIQTDGEENASKEFDYDKIRAMISTQEKQFSWEFVFIGANIDSFSVGSAIGVKASNTMNFAFSSQGINEGIASLSRNISSYRTGSKSDMTFEKRDYDAQTEAGA